jgi:ribonuclease HI
MKVCIYTDGASRGNPGESASGYLIFDAKHSLLEEEVFYNGVCTNNVAEYKAIVAALKRALKEHGNEVELVLHSDSRLVVNQLAGNYKIKDAKLKLLNKEARTLLKKFRKYELLNVPRENKYVSMVDKALNDFLDEQL